MAKLPMKKVEIIALFSDSKKIIERLQRRGVVEPENVEEERLDKVDTSALCAVFEKNEETARQAEEILARFAPAKKSLFASLSGTLNGRKPLSTRDFAAKKERCSETLATAGQICEKERQYTAALASAEKTRRQIDRLVPWKTLTEKGTFTGTKYTAFYTVSFPKVWQEDALETVFAERGVPAEANRLFADKMQSFFTVVCLKENAAALEEILRDLEYTPVFLGFGNTPAEKIRELELEEKDYRKAAEVLRKEIAALGDKREDLAFFRDYLTMRIDKYRALEKVGMTRESVIIRGFVPAKYAPGLQEELEDRYICQVRIFDPGEDEDVPVLLENGRFSAPLESITEMYALPAKKDPDPSPVMAFFYYLLFGMMLSDAGYGLLMVVFTVIALAFFHPEERMKNTLRLFRNCGVSTLFWGILFGSWFGDLPQIIGKNFLGTGDFSTAVWFEPIDDPIKLLLFSFGIGILHLFLGVGVKGVMLLKEGKPFDAFCETVPIYLTILGVAPLGASILTSVPAVLSEIGKWMMIAGVALLLVTAGRSGKNLFARLFGGLYTLYNVATGYLGDILSYSRLLALGLATGSIAGVINMICVMPENRTVKIVALIVVGAVAHIANLAINLLGAYVHSDRLAFVELFNKFYEGGGKPFAPLKANTKSFRFEKENIYHD